MTGERWDDALRRELVVAAARRQARRRSRPGRVAAGLGVATAAVAALALGPTEAGAEVRVERTGGRLVVTLVELDDPRTAEAELRAAGLDVRIEEVPAGPSAVGRFVGTTDSGGLPTELVPVDGGAGSFAAFSLPQGWRGSLHLLVGRPPRDGEAYVGFSDALAPGEPLACLPLVGRRAEEAVGVVERAAREPGLHAAFRRFDEPDAPALGAGALRGPYAGWQVLRADAIAPDQVVVWLVPPRAAQPASPAGPSACGR
jgi:hypothetical protein